MPDLTYHPYAQCQAPFKTYEVQGSKGKAYKVQLLERLGVWTCTCPAFFYQKGEDYDKSPCKHIKSVEPHICQWHQFHDGGEPTPDGKCPKCGEAVEYRMVGV